MSKFLWISILVIFGVVLLFVVIQVCFITTLWQNSEVGEPEKLPSVGAICLDKFAYLKIVEGKHTCQDSSNNIKVQLEGGQKRDLSVKGVAFFNGQELVFKSYEVVGTNELKVYNFDYDKKISSIGYSVIVDDEGEEVICSINGGYKLQDC